MPESENVNVTEVRRWAKMAGYDVPARGALKQEIYDAYNERDQSVENDSPESTSDEAPAGHTDESGITDEVTATVDSDVEPVEDDDDDDDKQPPAEESTSDGENLKLYRLAWGVPTNVPDDDVTRQRATRNRVSVQTLENGFIHYQRHAGTDEVQARLAERGLYRGMANGEANETTVMAYARFQDSIGLPGTGIPERTSLEALGFDVLE